MTINNMDKRVIKTQKAIKKAFKKLLLAEDFNKVTVKMITDEAEIGRKTFYLHYLDKYDLLDSIIDDYLNQLVKICKESPQDNMVNDALIWFSFFDQERELFKKMFEGVSTYSFRDKFLGFTIDQINDKLESEEMKNYETIVRFLSYGVVGLIESYIIGTVVHDSQDLAEKVAKLVYDNLDLIDSRLYEED